MERRNRLWIWLLVGVLLFIWGNSLLPASVSGAISSWLHRILTAALPGDGNGSGGDGLLRKMAHFTEFALLGIVLFRLIRNWEDTIGVAWILTLSSGFVAACVDELLQHFSPGRGPRFGDVCIDTAGVLTGTLVYLIAIHIRKSKTIK